MCRSSVATAAPPAADAAVTALNKTNVLVRGKRQRSLKSSAPTKQTNRPGEQRKVLQGRCSVETRHVCVPPSVFEFPWLWLGRGCIILRPSVAHLCTTMRRGKCKRRERDGGRKRVAMQFYGHQIIQARDLCVHDDTDLECQDSITNVCACKLAQWIQEPAFRCSRQEVRIPFNSSILFFPPFSFSPKLFFRHFDIDSIRMFLEESKYLISELLFLEFSNTYVPRFF